MTIAAFLSKAPISLAIFSRYKLNLHPSVCTLYSNWRRNCQKNLKNEFYYDKNTYERANFTNKESSNFDDIIFYTNFLVKLEGI